MTKQEFASLVKQSVVILDGATGTNLMDAGMPVGVCPEQWILEHPEPFLALQEAYVAAGTQILYAPTFTANRIKLEEYGLAEHLQEMNHSLVALSKQAAKGQALVAADMTMTGKTLYPMGDFSFEELVEVYKEQARVLVEAGVDLFVVETMMSLQECRAAVFAIREVCELPVMVSLTYQQDGRTLYGTEPKTAVVVLQELGVDAIGINCSTGPEDMAAPVKEMMEYAKIPVFAKPNAGLPELEQGKTVYKTTPLEFAAAGKMLVEAGAALIGGCCGTTPEHIQALAETVKGIIPKTPLATKRRILTSERKAVEISLDGNFLVIGERINPTGKKKLQESLKKNDLSLVREMAMNQEEQGAVILDINMGMNGIDEKKMMEEVIYEVSSTVDTPLCIDSSYVEVIESALRIYPGRALINSISMESEKMEQLLPIAKKYGAMFILLPLSDAGLPKTIGEKHEIIEKIQARALEYGLSKEDIIVDGLVATIGANPEAAKECFATFSYCKETLQLPTVCGLSNISFGLPERSYVNTAFLTMAIGRGLTMAIANPAQELLMNAAFASDMLLHRKESDIRYIERMNFLKEHPQAEPKTIKPVESRKTSENQEPLKQAELELEIASHPIYQAVLKGNKNQILDMVKAALKEDAADSKKSPEQIINEYLIPAIGRVGELFDQQKYFLPQLIGSANTMKIAIEYLEPMLERTEGETKETLVIATVEGDIHDIGKNLVVLMLKNYGYQVIDLGKDVPAQQIVETAMKEQAAVIGLSALMTTTMMRMKDVVELAKEMNCTSKIVIGGAAITESFAQEIGADGYSKDAAECVKLVQKLLGEDF